jgi:uncharacterized tellurite resistance protein B-like protein
MPVILAIVGAFFSGLFMWVVWGNGMEVINHWLDQRSAKAKTEKDAMAIAAARERAARAPLRAIEDPREAVMVLLSKLAMLRGDITAEQNVALSRIAMERLGLPGKAEHHTALAAFAAKSSGDADSVVTDLMPLLWAQLTPEEKTDFFGMLDEIAALHGGPTEPQDQMITRIRTRLEAKR